MKSIYWVIVIAVVLFILGGGYWFIQSNKSGESEVTVSPASSIQEQPEAATSSSNTPNFEDVQINVGSITLKSVGNYTGSGTATRVFANGAFTHTVSASIEDPSTGKFYEGWLVNMSLTPKFFSTGKLIKEGGVYKLTYNSDKDYSNYNSVVVTEEAEANGLDGVPEAHVLEGEFSN